MNNENLKSNKIDAQTWLERNYPQFIQRKLKKLDISNLGLTGSLDLTGFPKLEELDCSGNKITNLVLFGCPNLKELTADKGTKTFATYQVKELLINNLRKRMEAKKERRQAQIIPRHTTTWTDLDLGFTFELTQAWKETGFSKEQVREWISVGFKPQDLKLCVWLRDVKQVDAERALNYYSERKIRQAFVDWQQEQLTTQIEQLLIK